jgi:hypothetical protein
VFTRKPLLKKNHFFVLVPTAKLRRNDRSDFAKKHSAKKHNHVITFNYVITKLKIKVATGKIGLYY